MTDMPITDTTDDELADLIRANFKIRDLVAIWYDEDDGRQYMVKGGLDVMGRMFIYIRGITDSGGVGVQIIPMSKIVDIELMPEQRDPYALEEKIQEELLRQTWNKSSYEERTLQELRAAKESADAEDSEGRAAAVRAIQEAIWNEDDRPFDQDGATFAEAFSAKERDPKDGLIHCGQCTDAFRSYIPYWAHLDDHDAQVLGTME